MQYVPFHNTRTGEVRKVKAGWSWTPSGNDQTAALSLVLNFISLGLSVFIGIKGNELTAKHLLTQGWSVAHMDASTAAALKRWNIIDPPIAAALR